MIHYTLVEMRKSWKVNTQIHIMIENQDRELEFRISLFKLFSKNEILY
jgi:hypothetical protein